MSEIERVDSADYAHELDSQIRALAHHAHVVIEALYALVEEAKAANVHEALGFPSWTAYLADALDGRWKLERDKRGEAIRFLAEQGVSTRAISRITGASKGTVHRELADCPDLGQVIGLDGRTYTRPEPRPSAPLGQSEETDEEFIARMLDRADGPRTIRIPDTLDGVRERMEQITAEQRRIKRIMFDHAFAVVDAMPAGWERDAYQVGLTFRRRRCELAWLIEDGMDLDSVAEHSGVPVGQLEDILDEQHSGAVEDYLARVIALAE